MEFAIAAIAILCIIAVSIGVVWVVANEYIKWRHKSRMSKADYATAMADAAKTHAEAEAIILQARQLPVNAGGAYGYLNEKTGAIVRPTINPNVSGHISVTSSNTRREEAQAVGTQDEPYTPNLPDHVDLWQVLSVTRPDSRSLSLIIGMAPSGPIVRPFGDDTLHFGFIGATGSGKTSQEHSTLFQLALHDPQARRINFGFLDLNGKSSKPFTNAPHTKFIARDPQAMAGHLINLEAEVNRREALTEDEVERLPAWVIILEEMLSLRVLLDKPSWQRLKILLTRSRQSRMYFIGVGQNFYSDIETRTIRGQLRTRCAFACEDSGTLDAFGFSGRDVQAPLFADPPPGRFLMRTRSGIVLAQAPYIAPADIARHFAQARVAPAQTVAHPTTGRTPVQTIVVSGLPPASDIKKERARACYRPGISVRGLAEIAACSEGIAAAVIREMRGVQ